MANKREMTSVVNKLDEIEKKLASIEKGNQDYRNNLDSKLNHLLKELELIQESQSVLSDKYDTLFLSYQENKQNLIELKKENQELKVELNLLKDQFNLSETAINDLEQYSRRDCLEINGIPQNTDENTDDIVVAIAKKVGLNITANDISTSHRLGKPGQYGKNVYPNIIVKFTSRKTRDLFYSKKKQLLSANTQSSSFQSSNSTIYLNESLTTKNKKIFNACRMFKRNNKWKVVWTKNGITYLKKDKNANTIKILSEDDLAKIGISS